MLSARLVNMAILKFHNRTRLIKVQRVVVQAVQKGMRNKSRVVQRVPLALWVHIAERLDTPNVWNVLVGILQVEMSLRNVSNVHQGGPNLKTALKDVRNVPLDMLLDRPPH